MLNEYLQQIERFFEGHEVRDYRFDHRSKHMQVKGTFNGKPFRVTFPKTGSDWRGPLNAIKDLRHAMGLVGATAHNNQEPKRKRQTKRRTNNHHTVLAALSPLITEPHVYVDRYYTPLQIIKQRLVATADERQPTLGNANPSEDAIARPTASGPVDRVHLITPWLGKRARYATGI